MRVLVGKTFGIGNAVLSVPMVKALFRHGPVDVLVGSGPDDFGAAEVFDQLVRAYPGPGRFVNRIYRDSVPLSEEYDVAIMAIPFDGRWSNGVHFRAKRVMDARKRPGNVERLGFDMWEKHEADYQMENARELGYEGEVPDSSFMPRAINSDSDLVYVGLGYKRDPGGFGISKHFGNSRYAQLIQTIRRIRPQVKFVSTGGVADLIQSWYQIIKECGPNYSQYYRFPMLGLAQSFSTLAACGAYIGNDTGMMHVAASCGMPTCGLFAYPGLVTKNPPFCDKSLSIVFGKDFPPVDHIAQQFVDFVWGKK